VWIKKNAEFLYGNFLRNGYFEKPEKTWEIFKSF